MRILITGNMGYVGPCVVRHFRRRMPEAYLIGCDAAYFADALLPASAAPENPPDRQLLGDVRAFPDSYLKHIDAVVHLAGISNDPMGKEFEAATMDVNHKASVALAIRARDAGVRSFVFASSCSVYGSAKNGECTEKSAVNPLTTYAKSKYYAETDLAALATSDFTVTCLRFATACGVSPRLRLDLVLNDFVATAIRTGEIRVLSDGSPWRPLINVTDMARAIEWAVLRTSSDGGQVLAVNVGSDAWNFQVRDLARAVAAEIPGTTIHINRDAQPDKRSYRVCFELFRKLAPQHQPQSTLDSCIAGLSAALRQAGANRPEFEPRRLIRLDTLVNLKKMALLDSDLKWRVGAEFATVGPTCL